MRHKLSTTGSIEGLRAAFEKLRDRPFPDDSDSEDASQLHAELAEFDGYVAGRITTLLSGARLSSHELESDKGLRQRLEALAVSDSPGAADAHRYLEYFAELDRLLAIGRRLAR
jgi:hypothetical protein